jgi:hypothetical protein
MIYPTQWNGNVFFCSLFYHAIICKLYSIKWYDDWWIKNWKGFGRKQSWPKLGVNLEFAWRDWRKPRKSSVRTATVLAKIWTTQILYTNLDHWHHTCLVAVMIKMMVSTHNLILNTESEPMWELGSLHFNKIHSRISIIKDFNSLKDIPLPASE